MSNAVSVRLYRESGPASSAVWFGRGGAVQQRKAAVRVQFDVRGHQAYTRSRNHSSVSRSQ